MFNFDFDAWAELAKASPEEFEARRREVIESLIANSGNVNMLQGLQCRIEMERMRARTPLKSCLRLSTLMSDAFLNMNDALHDFVHGPQSKTKRLRQPKEPAQVIYISTESKPVVS
jgi:hypothetical protein